MLQIWQHGSKCWPNNTCTWRQVFQQILALHDKVSWTMVFDIIHTMQIFAISAEAAIQLHNRIGGWDFLSTADLRFIAIGGHCYSRPSFHDEIKLLSYLGIMLSACCAEAVDSGSGYRHVWCDMLGLFPGQVWHNSYLLLLNFSKSHGAGVFEVGVGLMAAWSISGYSVTTDGVSIIVGHYNHYNHWKYLCTTSVCRWCKLDGWSASEWWVLLHLEWVGCWQN